MDLLLAWIATASVLALVLCGWDKAAAKRRRTRVPERTLLGLALAGGAAGLLLGMMAFRHKTRKPLFVALVPLALAGHVAVLLLL